MHYSSVLLALASASVVAAAGSGGVPQGFNYGNMKGNGYEPKVEADYEKEFKAAQALQGTNGAYSSARLYTMIQAGTTDDPNQAISAAIKTKTRMLLGMWCSGPETGFAKELSALNNAITTYGKDFTDLVDGISVGSEDLYRISDLGVQNKSPVGAEPSTIVKFIKQVRQAFAGNKKDPVSDIKVGHVDTWTAWTNSSNQEVIDNCDWIGVDAYPYWQGTMNNNISEAGTLFFDAIKKTEAVVGKKPVWITETGWPVEGNKTNLAVADIQNAAMFYDGVGCKILGKYPTWWYILNENGASPDFSVADKSYKPLYDLSCKNAKNADPLMSGSKDDGSSGNSSDSSGSGSSGSNGGGSGGSSTEGGSASSTASGAAASGTGNSAATSKAANCMFALALAGVVALMI